MVRGSGLGSKPGPAMLVNDEWQKTETSIEIIFDQKYVLQNSTDILQINQDEIYFGCDTALLICPSMNNYVTNQYKFEQKYQ